MCPPPCRQVLYEKVYASLRRPYGSSEALVGWEKDIEKVEAKKDEPPGDYSGESSRVVEVRLWLFEIFGKLSMYEQHTSVSKGVVLLVLRAYLLDPRLGASRSMWADTYANDGEGKVRALKAIIKSGSKGSIDQTQRREVIESEVKASLEKFKVVLKDFGIDENCKDVADVVHKKFVNHGDESPQACVSDRGNPHVHPADFLKKVKETFPATHTWMALLWLLSEQSEFPREDLGIKNKAERRESGKLAGLLIDLVFDIAFEFPELHDVVALPVPFLNCLGRIFPRVCIDRAIQLFDETLQRDRETSNNLKRKPWVRGRSSMARHLDPLELVVTP